jgi:hypothetical protein
MSGRAKAGRFISWVPPNMAKYATPLCPLGAESAVAYQPRATPWVFEAIRSDAP